MAAEVMEVKVAVRARTEGAEREAEVKAAVVHCEGHCTRSF